MKNNINPKFGVKPMRSKKEKLPDAIKIGHTIIIKMCAG